MDFWLEQWRGTGDVSGMLTAAKVNGYTMSDIATVMGWDYAQLVERAKEEGVPRFASGAAFTNGIATRPTAFNMGLMGEDGPEAIMPLTNVGGRLGVAAVGTTDSSLVERVNNLEIVLQVIAVNTSKVARILDSAQGEDGRSIMTTST